MARELTVRERGDLKRRIDAVLDELYKQASQLGQSMGDVFTMGNRSQLRNLETVAGAATRSSTLKNHVKSQTGKDRLRYERNQTWALSRDDSPLGTQTLKLLNELPGRASGIVEALKLGLSKEESAELARTVEIELQRGLVQTTVCAALYGDLGEP